MVHSFTAIESHGSCGSGYCGASWGDIDTNLVEVSTLAFFNTFNEHVVGLVRPMQNVFLPLASNGQLQMSVLENDDIYDDEIGRIQNKEKSNKKPLIKRIYQKIFGVKMWKKPELTIFLDVSPEVAYSRKQDYSFEKMLEVNKDYKDYMYKVYGVKIVNADQNQEKIYSEIIKFILGLKK